MHRRLPTTSKCLVLLVPVSVYHDEMIHYYHINMKYILHLCQKAKRERRAKVKGQNPYRGYGEEKAKFTEKKIRDASQIDRVVEGFFLCFFRYFCIIFCDASVYLTILCLCEGNTRQALETGKRDREISLR